MLPTQLLWALRFSLQGTVGAEMQERFLVWTPVLHWAHSLHCPQLPTYIHIYVYLNKFFFWNKVLLKSILLHFWSYPKLNPRLKNLPIFEGHCTIPQFLKSCVFSEPHPSVLGHDLIRCWLPLPQDLNE